jgi:hypothetical protein
VRPVALLFATLGILFLFSFGVFVGCGPEKSSVEPTEGAEAVGLQINEASVRSHLAHLTGETPVSLQSGKTTISERGSEKGRRAAAEYMRESFEDTGVPARILPFDAYNLHGYNVEATLKGTEGDKHLWITAHLDSVHNAGAEDDASGLVLLLLVAKALQRLDLRYTVHLVAFDLEEEGLLGSGEYVLTVVRPIQEREGKAAIIGDIQSDMVGYEENEFNAFVETCNQAGPIDEALTSASRAIDPPITLSEGCSQRLAGRSDHQHFRDSGLPAVALTDSAKYDSYPCYHKPCDTMTNINLTYLQSMIWMVATASALLAMPQTR